MDENLKLTITVSQLAKCLGIGMNSAYSLVNKNTFPKIVVGRRILIPKKGLQEWLDKESRIAI